MNKLQSKIDYSYMKSKLVLELNNLDLGLYSVYSTDPYLSTLGVLAMYNSSKGKIRYEHDGEFKTFHESTSGTPEYKMLSVIEAFDKFLSENAMPHETCNINQNIETCNKNQDNANIDTSDTKQEQDTVLEKSNRKQETETSLEKGNKKQNKSSHGGKRAGAGRKKTDLPTKPMRINQYERDLIEQLRTMNGDVKQNVKRLLEIRYTADEMGLNKEDVIKGNMTK